MSKETPVQKYESITDLFNKFIGREIAVTETTHTYKIGNGTLTQTHCTFANKKDLVVEDMRQTALSRGYTNVEVYLPGALKIGKSPQINGSSKKSIIVDVKKNKENGTFHVAGYKITPWG